MSAASAGIAAPVDDDGAITDLWGVLNLRPGTTFMVTVSGTSMVGARIDDGDRLLVERSEVASDGDIVIVALDGMVTVKRLRLQDGMVVLSPENDELVPVMVPLLSELHVWGIVRWALHRP